MRYRVECHFGHGWEWYASTDVELDAYRWARALSSDEWAVRIIDTSTGKIIHSR